MNEPQIIILADDLTGAADAGGIFGDLGLTAIVNLGSSVSHPGDVVVINTHSRHLSLKEACQKNISAIQSLPNPEKSLSSGWIYKKIDSTLRGHPGAELRAIMGALNCTLALVAPAFPDQGRTTVNARQWVDGQPLESTPFKKQLPSSSLQTLFAPNSQAHQIKCIDLSSVRQGAEFVTRLLKEHFPTIFIADAETEEDLRTLATAAIAENIRLLCGSAGLSRALGQVLILRSTAPAPDVPLPKGGPIFIIAGSLHPATHHQVEHLTRSGTKMLSPVALDMWTAQSVVLHLSKSQDVLLSTQNIESFKADSQKIVQSLRWLTTQVMEEVRIGGLILTGGDTALGVLQSIQCQTLWLHGEIEPGIPWGQLLGGSHPGLAVVTKAGGFGNDRSLIKALAHIKKNQIRRQNVPT